jgi:hypothetical protein
MVVDAECGMPLDLGKWEALWEDGADDSGAQPAIDTLSPFLSYPVSDAPLVPFSF